MLYFFILVFVGLVFACSSYSPSKDVSQVVT